MWVFNSHRFHGMIVWCCCSDLCDPAVPCDKQRQSNTCLDRRLDRPAIFDTSLFIYDVNRESSHSQQLHWPVLEIQISCKSKR